MSKNNHQLLLGAHLSIAGGFQEALVTAQKINCTCVQIFTHSNRQWHMKPIQQAEIDTFREARKKTGIHHIVVHASYLINCASPNIATREQSIKTLVQELERCDQLEIPYLVLHPGSSLTAPQEDGVNNLITSLNSVFEQHAGPAMLLLENMAGQGSALGIHFEQLAQIRAGVHDKKRVGFCFDTCHAFAAGYDFTSPESYRALWEKFDAILGLDHLKVMHINDSKTPRGSNVDRHAHIGEGSLGLEAFALLMNDPRFFDVPKILETPKEDGLVEDIKNLKTLTELLTTEAKKSLGMS